jgi:hypothetical protein
MTKIDKLIQINSFCEYNKISRNFGNIKFSAFVEYNSPSYKKNGISEIIISMGAPKEGETRLLSDIFNDSPHIEFNPKYQDFNFDITNNKLVISGYSMKIGAAYEVSLLVYNL